MSVKNVCIIGGGASGLITLYHMRSKGINAILYEKNNYIGGVWKYSQHSPLYASLVTNLPKEVMQYHVDFPFPEHLPSFIRHTDVLQYLYEFATTTNLLPHIVLNTSVVHVDRSTSGVKKWHVSLQHSNEASSVECFDHIVVCNGHFNVPALPKIPGLDNFKGVVMHSMQYKTPEMFRNQTVLIVGVKSSGTDITREVATVASHVHICDRRQHRTMTSPLGHTIHGAIECVEDNGAFRMSTGEVILVDAVIFCTGYEYSTPFLSSVTTSPKSVEPLYEHVFFTHDPSLSFVGLPMTIIPFPVFYLQAQWIASVISGETDLPSCDEMEIWRNDFEEELKSKGAYPHGYHIFSMKMFPYMRRIAARLHSECYVQQVLVWIQVLEQIYDDVGSHRPYIIGDDDRYRRRNYCVDFDAGKWRVQEPVND